MDESKRVVPYSKGQALADEFGIQFFETSAKSNLKVDEVSNAFATPCFALNCAHACALVLPLSLFHRQEQQGCAAALRYLADFAECDCVSYLCPEPAEHRSLRYTAYQ